MSVKKKPLLIHFKCSFFYIITFKVRWALLYCIKFILWYVLWMCYKCRGSFFLNRISLFSSRVSIFQRSFHLIIHANHLGDLIHLSKNYSFLYNKLIYSEWDFQNCFQFSTDLLCFPWIQNLPPSQTVTSALQGHRQINVFLKYKV